MLTQPNRDEMGTYMAWMQAVRKAVRAHYANACPHCIEQRPRSDPTLLLPAQSCKIHNWRDPRAPLLRSDWVKVIPYFPEID